ncbi:MAG: glycosyltransferase family 2 protein [Lactobacillales bacterium]|jgi:glycosyltransferase involved in cell wall biosynthesis|nr:glycosyltransferase family 2 protein [Lactobacillales bacterium]
MRILLIIPAYNEEESIVSTINKIEQFKKSTDLAVDYVVINDGSTDKTAEILENHEMNHVDLVTNLGIGGAVQTGYRYAQKFNYDIAVQFDGDGQHDIASLPDLVAPILRGDVDFTIGSRFVKNSSSEFQTTASRRLGINILSGLIHLFNRKKILDVTSGYRAADKKVINYFAERYPQKFPEPETLVHLIRKKYQIEEIPVNMFEREGGASSIHSIKSVIYMVEVSIAILANSFMREGD